MCSGKFCRLKKHFLKLLAEAAINVVNAGPRVKCAVFSKKNKQNRFFLKYDQGICFFEETQNSIQDVIGDVSYPGTFFFNTNVCLCPFIEEQR